MTDEMSAARYRAIRKQLGLNQAQLAKQLGIVKATVSAWENGKTNPRLDTARQLAALINASVDWVLAGTGEALAGRVGGSKAVANGNATDNDVRHMMMRGLMQTLPVPGVEWPVAQQALWLQTAANILTLLYKSDTAGTVKIEVSE